ncbi:hypothetical protein [Streptomyces shenzhenensis]|uniref:hypothetical protein n=1 Tax=Streptomyces shenzhenensis TaxID=943815 RepID=UPI001F3393C5|nr:hypothetical protein [Streptomyces shenzhenensis]
MAESEPGYAPGSFRANRAAGPSGSSAISGALVCLDTATTSWLKRGGQGRTEELERYCDQPLPALRKSS